MVLNRTITYRPTNRVSLFHALSLLLLKSNVHKVNLLWDKEMCGGKNYMSCLPSLSPQHQHMATNPGWCHGVGHYGSHDPHHSPADIPQVSQNALLSDWFSHSRSLIQDGLWDVRRPQAAAVKAMRIYWNFCFKNIWSANGWLISVHERRCKGEYQ